MLPFGVVLVQQDEGEIVGSLDLQELALHVVVALSTQTGQEERVSIAASKDIRSMHIL